MRFCLHAACLVFYLLVLTTHIGGGVTGWNGRAPRQYTGQLSPKLWTFAWELPQWCSGCSGWDMYELLVELLGWLITFSRWVEEAYQLSVSGSLGAYLSNGCKPSLACPRSPTPPCRWHVPPPPAPLRMVHNHPLLTYPPPAPSPAGNKLDFISFFFMAVALHQRILTWADSGTGMLLSDELLEELLHSALKLQAIATTLAYTRFLEVLAGLSPQIGLLVTVMHEMMADSVPVLFMMFVTTAGTGVAFTGFIPAATASLEVFERPWAVPLWAMLGDFDVHMIYEQLGSRELILPMILFLYTFGTTIFLVNLLIAQMTSSYERIVPNSKIHLLYQRLTLVREYKDTRTAPPPLNLLFGVRGTGSLALLYFAILAGGCVAQLFAWTYGFPVLTQVLGDGWASVFLHLSTWGTVFVEGALVVLWVTRLHQLRDLIGSGVPCLGALLGCLSALAGCGENHFCHSGTDRFARRRGGFSVSATPSMSKAVERRERSALQSSLRRRRAEEARTWEAQLGGVRDAQARLENEQRLVTEQLNGRLDRFRKRFDDLGKLLQRIDSSQAPVHGAWASPASRCGGGPLGAGAGSAAVMGAGLVDGGVDGGGVDGGGRASIGSVGSVGSAASSKAGARGGTVGSGQSLFAGLFGGGLLGSEESAARPPPVPPLRLPVRQRSQSRLTRPVTLPSTPERPEPLVVPEDDDDASAEDAPHAAASAAKRIQERSTQLAVARQLEEMRAVFVPRAASPPRQPQRGAASAAAAAPGSAPSEADHAPLNPPCGERRIRAGSIAGPNPLRGGRDQGGRSRKRRRRAEEEAAQHPAPPASAQLAAKAGADAARTHAR